MLIGFNLPLSVPSRAMSRLMHRSKAALLNHLVGTHDSGIAIPSAFAELRLTIRSNIFGTPLLLSAVLISNESSSFIRITGCPKLDVAKGS
jgi:hypothetical protein